MLKVAVNKNVCQITSMPAKVIIILLYDINVLD